MRKISRKHILGVLRDVSLSLYGRIPDSKMLLCRIAGFGYTNPSRTTSVKRRVKSHDKALGSRNRRTNHISRGTSWGCSR